MRPFVAWDGEGYDTEEVVAYDKTGKPVHRHNYMLFGCSLRHEVSSERLTARECLDLLLDVERENPDAIHVVFSGNYDVVKILEDWPVDELRKLYQGEIVSFDGYSVEYHPGKTFRVSREGTSVTLFDVFSYFGTSFVKACLQYLGDDPRISKVQVGKEARGRFEYSELDEKIRPYMRTELDLLVDLCTRLRTYLERIGLKTDQWHGPGAVANALNRTYGIAKHQSDYDRPKELQHALQCSYAGGRFEAFRVGKHNGPVWQHDRNSAYPHAITQLPTLAGGWWERLGADEIDLDDPGFDFGVWSVSFDGTGSVHDDEFGRTPWPLFWRSKDSLIFYPRQIVQGWYRGVEVRSMASWFESDCWQINGGWQFTPRNHVRPYAFVEGLYKKRLEYQAEGNPTEFAVKIALNSIYGKTVQHTGYDPRKHNVPQWHQLEWGSYITADMRAWLFDAMMRAHVKDPASLIAVETDALFTTTPLDLPISNRLGDWKVETYDSILYLQSGMYFVNETRGKAKTRGIEAGNITYEDAMGYLSRFLEAENEFDLVGRTHRFGAMGQHLGKPTLGGWFDQERHIGISESDGKRFHLRDSCDACPTPLDSRTHSLVSADRGHSPSWPYVLPWEDGGTGNRFRDERDSRHEQPTLF